MVWPFQTAVPSHQYNNLCRVRECAHVKFLVSRQRERLCYPCDPTLLRSLLLRRALFLVETTFVQLRTRVEQCEPEIRDTVLSFCPTIVSPTGHEWAMTDCSWTGKSI